VSAALCRLLPAWAHGVPSWRGRDLNPRSQPYEGREDDRTPLPRCDPSGTQYPARESNSVPPGKSRMHHRNACGAGNRIRVLAAPPASRAPRDRTWRYRFIRAAPSTSWVVPVERKVRVPTPAAREDRHGCSKPAAAPAAHLPLRNKEVPTPTACAASRFRGGARHLAGSRSRTALRPGVNRPEMAEGGEVESHGVTRASLSGRARPPGRFTFHEYRPGDSNPDRQVPKTCASTSWARTARE
jgi:hypothetical protein